MAVAGRGTHTSQQQQNHRNRKPAEQSHFSSPSHYIYQHPIGQSKSHSQRTERLPLSTMKFWQGYRCRTFPEKSEELCSIFLFFFLLFPHFIPSHLSPTPMPAHHFRATGNKWVSSLALAGDLHFPWRFSVLRSTVDDMRIRLTGLERQHRDGVHLPAEENALRPGSNLCQSRYHDTYHFWYPESPASYSQVWK